MKAECPECGNKIDFPVDVVSGEILICDNCSVELDVVSSDPPELMVFDEEEK